MFRLVPLEPQFFSEQVLPQLVLFLSNHQSAMIKPKQKIKIGLGNSGDLNHKHGSLLGVGQVALALSNYDPSLLSTSAIQVAFYHF